MIRHSFCSVFSMLLDKITKGHNHMQVLFFNTLTGRLLCVFFLVVQDSREDPLLVRLHRVVPAQSVRQQGKKCHQRTRRCFFSTPLTPFLFNFQLAAEIAPRVSLSVRGENAGKPLGRVKARALTKETVPQQWHLERASV